MKQVYKCDYCSFMGTKEEVREHEPKCRENYNLKSCHTCKHRKTVMKDSEFNYECKAGKDIPLNSIYRYCDLYERGEEDSAYTKLMNTLFSGLYK